MFQDGNIGPALDFSLQGQSNQLNYQRERDGLMAKQYKAAQDKALSAKAIGDIAKLDHIGNSTVDLTTDNALNGVTLKSLEMQAAGVPYSEIQAYIAQAVPPIVNGHTVAQNYSNQFKKQAIETAKEFGGDQEKLYQIAMEKAVPDWVEAGANGVVKYRSMIDPNKNYMGDMTSDDNLPLWTSKGDDLIKHVSGLPKDLITQNKIVRDKGFAHIDKNTEEVNSLWEGNYDGKNLIGKKLKVDEKGLIPESSMGLFLSNPKAKKDFAHEYAPIKAAKLKQMKEFGLGDTLSPEVEDYLKRELATKMINSTISSGLKSTNEIQDITPKPAAVTKNSFNIGNNNVPVRKLYQDAKTAAVTAGEKGFYGAPLSEQHPEVKKIARQLAEEALGKTDLKDNKIYLRWENDQLWVMDASKPKVDGELPSNAYLAPLPEDVVDLGANQTLGAPSKKKIQAGINAGGNQPAPAKPNTKAPLLQGKIR